MKTQREMYKGLGAYGTLGLEIVFSFLLGMFGGKWLDDRYGTTPWLFVAGLLLAIGLSVSGILRALKLMRAAAAPSPDDRPALYESSTEREEHRKRGERFDPDPVVERIPDSEGAGGTDGSTDEKKKSRKAPS